MHPVMGALLSVESLMRRLRHLTNRHRTPSTNIALGLLLAFNAGAVNAGGFLVLRMYTSHMTGFCLSTG